MTYSTRDFSRPGNYLDEAPYNEARIAFPDRAVICFLSGVVLAAVVVLGFVVLTS